VFAIAVVGEDLDVRRGAAVIGGVVDVDGDAERRAFRDRLGVDAVDREGEEEALFERLAGGAGGAAEGND
jgi:hypothetical protein